MRHGVGVAVRAMWRPWHGLVVITALVLLGVDAGFRNPWTLVVSNTSAGSFCGLLAPLYLFILKRDLFHPWEGLVGHRLGDTRTWWAVQTAAAGLYALGVTATVIALSGVGPLVTGGWSWQWGGLAAYEVGRHVVSTWRPWWWALDAFGLMAIGLWGMGALLQVLSRWWRSAWIAWVALVVLNLLPLDLMYSVHDWLWWLPGPQFSLLEHWTFANAFPPSWSVLYGGVLLLGSTIWGFVTVTTTRWDTVHGGAL